MKNIIKKFLKEQTEGQGENPLSQKEIRLFKYLNKNKKEYPTQSKLLDFIKSMMAFISRPESDARFYYELYTANYRPDGDYENIDKTTFKDFRQYKQRKTPNNTAYQFTSAKIPFKGSNLEGYWDVNTKNKWYYVVKSYGWYPIFLFVDNKWFRVNDRYSSTTGKQMSYSNPVRYNSGLNDNVYDVTRSEMDALVHGTAFEQLKSERVSKFIEPEVSQTLIGKSKWITIGWGEDKKKINFTIENITQEDEKIKIDVRINKAGKVEGVNKLIVDPKGYEVPSDFSNDVENGIERKIINNNSNFLSSDNTIFTFTHPKQS